MNPQEYSYREDAKRTNRIAAVGSLVFMLSGVAFFVLANRFPYPALWQLVALCLLCGAVYCLARQSIGFVYALEPDDRDARLGWDLTVSRYTGKRIVTDCRLGLGDLCELDMETPQTRQTLREKYHDDRVHSYCPDILPVRAVYLRFDDGGDRVVIRLQPSDELLARLQSALQTRG